MTTPEVVFNDHEVGEWIAAEAPCFYRPGIEHCIGLRAGSEIRGGFIYYSFTGSSIHASMAGRGKWVTRDLLWAAFHYPLVQLGVRKIFAVVDHANTPSVNMVARMGGKIEGIIQDMFPSGPAYIMALYRDGCRWLDYEPRGLKAGGSHEQG